MGRKAQEPNPEGQYILREWQSVAEAYRPIRTDGVNRSLYFAA
jgi:hypothetical protein